MFFPDKFICQMPNELRSIWTHFHALMHSYHSLTLNVHALFHTVISVSVILALVVSGNKGKPILEFPEICDEKLIMNPVLMNCQNGSIS